MNTMYGINNCQTVQKAKVYLDSKCIEYTFWDYKKSGIDSDHLIRWCDELGWDKVLNRAGMMWRKASDEDKAKVVDQNSAIEFMLKVPTSIKRPLVDTGSELVLGFDLDVYNTKF